jgi:hypothetical protein
VAALSSYGAAAAAAAAAVDDVDDVAQCFSTAMFVRVEVAVAVVKKRKREKKEEETHSETLRALWAFFLRVAAALRSMHAVVGEGRPWVMAETWPQGGHSARASRDGERGKKEKERGDAQAKWNDENPLLYCTQLTLCDNSTASHTHTLSLSLFPIEEENPLEKKNGRKSNVMQICISSTYVGWLLEYVSKVPRKFEFSFPFLLSLSLSLSLSIGCFPLPFLFSAQRKHTA